MSQGQERMGLPVSVLRTTSSDCSLNGVSHPDNHDELWVEVEGGHVSESEAKNRGLPLMAFKTISFGGKIFVSLRPDQNEADKVKWYMMGGNYATTSDGRFSEAVEKLCGYSHSAIAIHDRHEWLNYD